MKDRARLIEAAMDRFAVDSTKLSRAEQSRIARELLRQRSERFRWGLVASAAVFVISLAAAVTAYALKEPAFYQIRVTVLGVDGLPADGTELRASVDGVFKPLTGGWELEIPAAARPADGRVTLWATRGALNSPPVEVELGRQHRLNVEVRLERVEVEVRGVVVDAAGEAITGARVFVVGFEDGAVESGAGGNFVLNARVATGERVRLRAEKEGYRTRDQSHLAGRAPITLVLNEH